MNLYYEDQKPEALRAAEQFRASRIVKFFQHFQSVLETNPANKGDKGIKIFPVQFLEQFLNQPRSLPALKPHHGRGPGSVP